MEDFKKDSLPKYNKKLNRSKNLENEKIKRNLKDDKFYKYKLNISDSRIKYLDKIIKENPKMSTKKIDITNQLKLLYTTRKDFF